MTKVQQIKERVAKGIELLNIEYGRSWLRKIDPEWLALEDGAACVLGQIEGNYGDGAAKLGLSVGDVQAFGFGASRDATEQEICTEYQRLTRTWRQSIKNLQRLFKIQAPTFQH